jgi:hypothetical protein
MASNRPVFQGKVNIKSLQVFALNLLRNSRLRDLILAENDEIDVQEFLMKMNLWLKLFRMEFS